MRRLLPILFLLCFLPRAHASISLTGSGASTGTSTTISTGTVSTGNLNLFWAYHAASATVPSTPTPICATATTTGCYQKIGSYPASPTSTTGAALLYCRIATSSSDTGSGTATNATAVSGLSFSGINAASNLSATCAGMGAGQGIFHNATGSTTVTLSALTGGNAILNSNDWLAAFEGDSVASTCTPSTVWTNVAGGTTGDVWAGTSNGTVSSYSSNTTCTVSTGNHIEVVVVIAAPPQTGSSGPQFKRGYFSPGCGSNYTNCSATAVTTVMDAAHSCPNAPCPRYAGANDLVLIAATYPSATSLTISDSTAGSNTWTVDATTTDGSSYVHALIRSCLAATTTSVTATLGTAESTWQYHVMVFYNTTCGTSTPVDGTPVCAHGITPTTNLGHCILAGSVTTTANNDMVLQYIWDEADIGMNHQAFAFGFGDNQIGLADDWTSQSSGGYDAGGYGGQYFIQGTAGAVQTGACFVQNTHDTFSSCEVAYKSGTGGVVPSTHIAAVRSQSVYGVGAMTTKFQLPAIPGNMLVITNDSGVPAWSIFGNTPYTTVPTDNNGNTFAIIADTTDAASDPQIGYSCNPTLSTNETIYLTPGSNSGYDIVEFLEFTNANSSSYNGCLDTAATMGTGTQSPSSITNQLSATNSGACLAITTTSASAFTGYPICVPGSGNSDLFVDVTLMGTGPVTGNTTEEFDYVWGSGVGDNSPATNGNGVAHTFATGSLSSNWTATGSTSGMSALEAMFKENQSSPVTNPPHAGIF